jgi:hypothetical protein
MPNPRLSLGRRIARQLRIAARFLIPRVEPDVERRAITSTSSGSTRVGRRVRVTSRMLPAVLLAALSSPALAAGTIYVDSRRGNDALDGTTVTQVAARSGPVRTLSRAVRSVGPGDRIVLANNGTPYLGGLALYGLQQSGSPALPIEIIGNGCVLTGAKPIEPSAWKMIDGDVWRITPSRKGWYQLVLDGVAVPETPCPADAATRPDLAPGSWCAFSGAIYYHPAGELDPPEEPLALADEQTGLSLVAVEHVVIRDLTVRHFRQDGVHLFDRCRDVTLENVVCEANGRAGIVVGGTSNVVLRNVTCQANRAESLLVEELGVADAEESTFDVAPTVRPLGP